MNSGSAASATNIEFVINLLKHPTFLDYSYTTKFIDTTPEPLRNSPSASDRATKILTYIADITVNGHPETAGRAETAMPRCARRRPVRRRRSPSPPMGTRNLLEQKGPKAVADWMLKPSKKVLI